MNPPVNFANILQSISADISTSGYHTSSIPNYLKTFLAGELLSSLPRNLVEKLFQVYHENRCKYVECKFLNQTETEVLIKFTRSDFEFLDSWNEHDRKRKRGGQEIAGFSAVNHNSLHSSHAHLQHQQIQNPSRKPQRPVFSQHIHRANSPPIIIKKAETKACQTSSFQQIAQSSQPNSNISNATRTNLVRSPIDSQMLYHQHQPPVIPVSTTNSAILTRKNSLPNQNLKNNSNNNTKLAQDETENIMMQAIDKVLDKNNNRKSPKSSYFRPVTVPLPDDHKSSSKPLANLQILPKKITKTGSAGASVTLTQSQAVENTAAVSKDSSKTSTLQPGKSLQIPTTLSSLRTCGPFTPKGKKPMFTEYEYLTLNHYDHRRQSLQSLLGSKHLQSTYTTEELNVLPNEFTVIVCKLCDHPYTHITGDKGELKFLPKTPPPFICFHPEHQTCVDMFFQHGREKHDYPKNLDRRDEVKLSAEVYEHLEDLFPNKVYLRHFNNLVRNLDFKKYMNYKSANSNGNTSNSNSNVITNGITNGNTNSNSSNTSTHRKLTATINVLKPIPITTSATPTLSQAKTTLTETINNSLSKIRSSSPNQTINNSSTANNNNSAHNIEIIRLKANKIAASAMEINDNLIPSPPKLDNTPDLTKIISTIIRQTGKSPTPKKIRKRDGTPVSKEVSPKKLLKNMPPDEEAINKVASRLPDLNEKIVKNTDLIKAELNNYAELDDDQISTHSINNDASGLEIADEVLNRVLKNHASS